MYCFTATMVSSFQLWSIDVLRSENGVETQLNLKRFILCNGIFVRVARGNESSGEVFSNEMRCAEREYHLQIYCSPEYQGKEAEKPC